MLVQFLKRGLLLLILTVLLFAGTACNRKDDGVSPPQTTVKPSDAMNNFLANIENATFSIDLTQPEENPIAPAQNILLQNNLGVISRQPAISKASVAPNPLGQNLALSAIAGASSYWPWPLYGFPFTPDHGNNGNMADCWAASFQYYSHWYRLDWPTVQTIGRIYVTHAGVPLSQRGQTISSIRYYNPSTSSWTTIPGSFFTYGASKSPYVDFSFSPIQTTGIILYMNTGPENPHPNATVFINEIEVYGASASLKITSPASNTVFNLGENITFTGEKTGTVNNIQWSSNLSGTIGNTFPSIATSGLCVGTHTITLSGQSSTGQSLSDSITIGVKGGKPRVMKMAFKPMTGQTNWNKIYDRKGDFRKSTYLDPIQWQGKIAANEVVKDFCYPVSYVRSNATSVGNGPSKLKIEATFKDLEKAPSLNFTVNLTAKCKGNGIEKTLTFNPVAVSTSNDLETSKEFESIEGLPDVVGIWELEFEWKFTSNGADLGSQQTPQMGIQNLYTTWEKPKLFQNFDLVEYDPVTCLEIIKLSSNILTGYGSSQTQDDVMTHLLENFSPVGGFQYRDIPPEEGIPRGLNALLNESSVPKRGLCGELSLLLKALIEAHGIDVRVRQYWLKDPYFADYRLASSYLAVENIAPWNGSEWIFTVHATVLTKESLSHYSYDPTFKNKGNFINQFNALFNIVSNPDHALVSDVPIPDYVGFDETTGQPTFSDWD